MRSTFAWYLCWMSQWGKAKLELKDEKKGIFTFFLELFFLFCLYFIIELCSHSRCQSLDTVSISQKRIQTSNEYQKSERISFSIFSHSSFHLISLLCSFFDDLCVHGLRLWASAASELWMIGSNIRDIAASSAELCFFLCCQLSSSSTLFERFSFFISYPIFISKGDYFVLRVLIPSWVRNDIYTHCTIHKHFKSRLCVVFSSGFDGKFQFIFSDFVFLRIANKNHLNWWIFVVSTW